MHNHGNYIVSLGNFCRWLASRPRRWASRSIPGFAAAEVLYDEDGARARRRHRRHGHRQGRPADRQLSARASSCTRRQTMFAEGCRGSLTKTLFERFKLRDGVRSADLRHRHQGTVGDRAGQAPAGPGHPHHRLAAGPQHLRRVVPLSPRRTTRSRSASSSGSTTRIRTSRPFEEFQRFKTHPADPADSSRAAGGSPTARGRSTRAASSRIPKLIFPGGVLIGDTAGFLNVPKIKGTHTAMKSGMTAAEAAVRRARRRGAGRGDAPIPSAASRPGCGTSSTGCATSGRRSTGACGAASPTRRSTPTCFAGRRPGRFSNHADHTTLKPASAVPADRLPEARRQAHLRPALLGVPLQHQPRGEPALPSAAEGPGVPIGSIWHATTRRSSATARPGSTRSSGPAARPPACRSTRRTASTARPATSRTRRRTSTGWCRKGAAVPTIRICNAYI